MAVQCLWVVLLVGVLALHAGRPASGASTAPRKNDIVPFIVGGDDAEPGEFPEVVSIQIQSPDGTFQHLCGGFIIDKEWIVTAGHCLDQIDPAAVSVLAGANDLSQPGMLSYRTGIAGYEIHEDYDPDQGISIENDIALINLPEPLPLNAYIQEATLQHRTPQPGATAQVAGWGQTSNDNLEASNTLQWTSLGIVSKADCQNALDGFATILDDQLCAASSDGLEAECKGDSGGALIVDKMVVGIVSWSKKPCGKYPGVFASVPKHLPWIREKSGLDYL
ncbi:trypsin iota-like isoform X2 [Thrips palmi]|uniref:Trypsin iota-like isoform X2 n=1 Tax=Thrips palmi TaxID=161013 RepID=A0A6P8Y9E2_THRPL|nr:trypsin iota-like isoform X2 [Thrips palmi]